MARGGLSDEQWHCLEAVLPALPAMGRRPRGRRQVVDGIWWRARTGSPWRDVPERWAVGDLVFGLPPLADRRDSGPHPAETAAQGRCRRTYRVGGVPRLHDLPGPPACRRGLEKGGHNSSRTRPDGLPSEPADHAIGRSRGGLTTKIHLAVDSSFQVLAAVVTAGQRGDAALCTEVMNRIRVPRPGGGRPHTRPVHVLADRAYSSP